MAQSESQSPKDLRLFPLSSEELWVFPLVNFSSELQHARIETLELALLTPEEMRGIQNQSSLLGEFFPRHDVSGTKFKLVGSDAQAKDDAARVITALRLYKAGDVGASCAITIGQISTFEAYRVRRSRSFYTLCESDLPDVSTLVDALRKGEENRFRAMAVALRRFNQGYRREVAEDKIIDLAIALESCLLSEVEDELAYRFCLRGAALLADSRGPGETQSLLKAIYEARSKIVHKGKVLSELGRTLRSVTPPVETDEFPQRCEDIARDIFKAYLARLAEGQRIQVINKLLDKQIVDNLAPK